MAERCSSTWGEWESRHRCCVVEVQSAFCSWRCLPGGHNFLPVQFKEWDILDELGANICWQTYPLIDANVEVSQARELLYKEIQQITAKWIHRQMSQLLADTGAGHCLHHLTRHELLRREARQLQTLQCNLRLHLEKQLPKAKLAEKDSIEC